MDATYRDNGGRAEGLRYLVPDSKMQQWSDWRTYPCVIMPFDLGPDNVSGMHALQSKFKASAEGYLTRAMGSVAIQMVLLTTLGADL